MAPTLHDILLTPETQPAVVADCMTLIQQEVSAKSGVSGAGVKLAYKTANTFASGYLQSTVENLLPSFVTQLEPYWADYGASGASGFGDYLAKRGDEVSESLIGVTDEKARVSGRAAVVKAYQMVRGSASKNIETALPALGAMVQKYT